MMRAITIMTIHSINCSVNLLVQRLRKEQHETHNNDPILIDNE